MPTSTGRLVRQRASTDSLLSFSRPLFKHNKSGPSKVVLTCLAVGLETVQRIGLNSWVIRSIGGIAQGRRDDATEALAVRSGEDLLQVRHRHSLVGDRQDARFVYCLIYLVGIEAKQICSIGSVGDKARRLEVSPPSRGRAGPTIEYRPAQSSISRPAFSSASKPCA